MVYPFAALQHSLTQQPVGAGAALGSSGQGQCHLLFVAYTAALSLLPGAQPGAEAQRAATSQHTGHGTASSAL
jgi:hypothetical protein